MIKKIIDAYKFVVEWWDVLSVWLLLLPGVIFPVLIVLIVLYV